MVVVVGSLKGGAWRGWYRGEIWDGGGTMGSWDGEDERSLLIEMGGGVVV